ncbi:MAG: hypothetical protein K5851_03530 [Lachnospiraceae bacterium]|nr:hypothetical protein [Lachnospiraceae bacterium]
MKRLEKEMPKRKRRQKKIVAGTLGLAAVLTCAYFYNEPVENKQIRQKVLANALYGNSVTGEEEVKESFQEAINRHLKNKLSDEKMSSYVAKVITDKLDATNGFTDEQTRTLNLAIDSYLDGTTISNDITKNKKAISDIYTLSNSLYESNYQYVTGVDESLSKLVSDNESKDLDNLKELKTADKNLKTWLKEVKTDSDQKSEELDELIADCNKEIEKCNHRIDETNNALNSSNEELTSKIELVKNSLNSFSEEEKENNDLLRGDINKFVSNLNKQIEKEKNDASTFTNKDSEHDKKILENKTRIDSLKEYSEMTNEKVISNSSEIEALKNQLGGRTVKAVTKAEYNSITHDPNTIYIIVSD